MKIIGGCSLLLIIGIIISIDGLDENCIKKKRDIIVILDSSDSITNIEFENSKKAVVNFLSYFLISPTETRVSLVGFGEKSKVDFKFTKHVAAPTLNMAIRLHRRIGGGTAMGQALNLSLTEVVPEMREDVDRIMLVISDGKNTAFPPTKVIAPKIKAKNVQIYSIGIGSEISIPELQEISSDNTVTMYPDFLNMEKNILRLVNVICTLTYTTGYFTNPIVTEVSKTEELKPITTTNHVITTDSSFKPDIITKTTEFFSPTTTSLQGTTPFIPQTTKAATPFIPPTTKTKTTPFIPPTTKAETTLFIPPTTKAETTPFIPPTTKAETTPFIPQTTKAETTPFIPQTTKAEKPNFTTKLTATTTESNFKEISTPNQNCNYQKIDLMFVLDASSSLARYWKQELNFTNNVIESLQIGLKNSQVGVLIYSDIMEVSIPMGSIVNKTELQKSVANIELLEGCTFIANALNRAKEEFNISGRDGVKKTIILVTDGADNSPNMNPVEEAAKIKNSGIKMIVVGLGYSVLKDQLNAMSSSEKYYPIEDMSKLALFDTSTLAQDACHIEKPKRICSAKLDIALIIDCSSQVPNKEWINQLLFAKHFIEQFELDSNNTRFSIITFANEAVVEEQFTPIYNDLFKKLENVRHVGGFTRIDKAINLASKSFYLKSQTSKKLVVLLSNGLSLDKVQSIGASYDLQETGISLMTIGLGEKADIEELRILASPSMTFLRKDVKEDTTLLENAVKNACQPPENVVTNICPANGDIIFIVDQSTDNSNEIWEGIKSLMLTTIQSLNITKSNTRISIINYGDETKIEFRLDDNFTKRDVYVAVKQLKRQGNGANLSSALRRARQLFKIDYRVDVAKLVILFTDKLPDNQKDALYEAENLKVDGTTIFYVGLSKTSPYLFFDELATKKSSVKIDNINQIEKNKEQIRNMICDVFKNKQDECSMKKLDVIFAIDKSTSLGPENFQIELDFINRIVGNMDLRKDRTRVGIFTFNTVVDLNVAIDSNFDNAEIQKEINKIQFIEGLTGIGIVIENATTHFIEKGREGVPKVLVVLTDGANTIGVPPQIPAVEAKKLDIKIISLGVGGLISEKELKDISSSGEFYDIKTFKDLEKYNAKTISNDACQVPQKPTICQAAGDLIYIMGSAANTGTERFKQMSAFMKSLTKLTVVDKTKTRVAILKFNKGNYIDSGFKEDYKNFEESIEDMTTSTDGVFIGKALQRARFLFDSDKRMNATKTVIIISDSHIPDRNDSFHEADILKKSGIKIFTIGLTGQVSDSDMKAIASPDKALFVENFDNLQRYNTYISSELCEVIKGTNKECNNKQLEVMFALDSSSSIGPDYWQNELDFVDRIVKEMDISILLTRIGVVTFNTEARKEFGINKYSDKYAILSAVKGIPFDDGATAIGDALRECKWELMNNSRRDVPKVIVLVTDGVSNGGIAPEMESTEIKKLGITIITIGIGDSVSPGQLKVLSSSGTYHQILDFQTLKDYDTTFITRQSCKVGKTL